MVVVQVIIVSLYFFFFQAEDGIRDIGVTGVQTCALPIFKASEVMRHLIGRWFKNLRWIGMIRSDTGYTLQWISDDGSFQINLRLIAEYIVIETNASTEKEKVQAMVGSYAIYEHITRVMQSRFDEYALDRPNTGVIN